jgi:hypothetical protein
MKRVAIAALSVLLLSGAGETNWNWFGGSTVKGDPHWSFFDLNSMKKLPNGHMQVWTKTLSEKEMDEQKADDAVTDQAAHRIRYNYVPIVGRSGKFDKKQLTNMIIFESIANRNTVPPRMQVLFEIDCKGDLDRMLSVHIRDGENQTSSDSPTSWQHIVPETNAARLEGVVCQ